MFLDLFLIFCIVFFFFWLCWVFHCRVGGFLPCDSTQVSLAIARRLSCSMACGLLVPPPGIERVFPALEGRFLTTGQPGKSLHRFLIKIEIEIKSIHCNCWYITYLPVNPQPFSPYFLFLPLSTSSFFPPLSFLQYISWIMAGFCCLHTCGAV